MQTAAIYGEGIYGLSTYGVSKIGPSLDQIRKALFRSKCSGQIGKRFIFRVRRGNGYAQSVAGKLYQDIYSYFIPSTITHPNGDKARATFAAACGAWNALSELEKSQWHSEAIKHHRMKGHNLFIQKYMKENY